MAGPARQRLTASRLPRRAWFAALAVAAAGAAAADAASTAADVLPPQRIAQASAALLGKPYRVDPLGEGESGTLDRDPVWRDDAFDCLTFVETTIALARSADEREAAASLQRLRYRDGVVSFGTRNHFPEADWLPNNMASGQVRDISADVAAELRRPDWLADARGVVHRGAWLEALPHNPIQRANPLLHAAGPAQRAELARLAQQQGDATVDVRYLRLRERTAPELQRVIAALPEAALVFIVRPNTSMVGPVGAVTQLAHAGFVLRDAQGGTWFRNASSGRAKRVMDAPLLEYLQRMQRTRSFAGIVVLQVLAAK